MWDLKVLYDLLFTGTSSNCVQKEVGTILFFFPPLSFLSEQWNDNPNRLCETWKCCTNQSRAPLQHVYKRRCKFLPVLHWDCHQILAKSQPKSLRFSKFVWDSKLKKNFENLTYIRRSVNMIFRRFMPRNSFQSSEMPLETISASQ